jgi:hypothetical protein
MKALFEMSDSVFEVMTLKDGRWLIEQRHKEREAAIADANGLYATRAYKGVKVVREMFDQKANLFKESTVYELPSANNTAPKALAPDPRPRAARAKPAAKKGGKRGLFDFLKN